jgi:hypothetical protein
VESGKWKVEADLQVRLFLVRSVRLQADRRDRIGHAEATREPCLSLRQRSVGLFSGHCVAAVGGALRQAFGAHTPASTWIGVWSLAVPDFLIEIEATAVLD